LPVRPPSFLPLIFSCVIRWRKRKKKAKGEKRKRILPSNVSWIKDRKGEGKKSLGDSH